MTSRFLLASAFSIALLAQFSSAASAATITLINDPFTLSSANVGSASSSFELVSGGTSVYSGGLAIIRSTQFQSKNTFNFNAGDVINLSFNYFDDGGTVSLGSLFADTLIRGGSATNKLTYTKTFTVQSADSARFSFNENASVVAGGTTISDFVLTNTTGATSVPEPFTVIGTLVGGTAALRMRKKLKLDRSNDASDRN
jgi:hypothetical protein